MAYRIVVLASGSGTLLQALIDAVTHDELIDIAAVVTDRYDIAALDRAVAASIPTAVVPLKPGADRGQWDADLRDVVAGYGPDLVVSAGFMKLVGPTFLARFRSRMINTHPSLLPAFPGQHAVRDALAYGVRMSGATIFVVDEGVDTGEILDQVAVPVLADDNEATLHERIKTAERSLLIDIVRQYAASASSRA